MPKDKKEKLLPKYRSWLKSEEIAEGMNASIRNSQRLYYDAKLLYEHDRYPSSLGLSCLSIEESNKVSLLRGFATAKDIDAVKRQWRNFRNHSSKTLHWTWLTAIKRNLREEYGLDPGPKLKPEDTEMLPALKEVSFYVDCNGNRHWAEPELIVNKTLCEQMLEYARILSQRDTHFTSEEIQLWAKYLGEDDSDANNLIRWHEAMVEEGLTDLSHEKFVEFVRAYILGHRRSE